MYCSAVLPNKSGDARKEAILSNSHITTQHPAPWDTRVKLCHTPHPRTPAALPKHHHLTHPPMAGCARLVKFDRQRSLALVRYRLCTAVAHSEQCHMVMHVQATHLQSLARGQHSAHAESLAAPKQHTMTTSCSWYYKQLIMEVLKEGYMFCCSCHTHHRSKPAVPVR